MDKIRRAIMKHKLASVYFTVGFAYFAYFWARCLWQEPPGNLYVGQINIWGDWAVHFTMGSAMAYRDLFPLTSPLLLDAPFRYPFLSNWIAAVFIRAGAPFFGSFVWTSWCASLLGMAALFWFYKSLFKSERVAFFACAIYLLNGGIGFVYWIKDMLSSPNAFSTLLDLPRYYTHLPEMDLRWQSVIMSMMIPQRAFAFGLPIGVAVLAMIRSRPIKPMKLALAALCAGVLPLFSMHSFIAVGVVLAVYALGDIQELSWNEWGKKWVLFGGFVALFATPPVFFLFATPASRGGDFLTWLPGWYANQSISHWLVFWWKNWGPTLICAMAGYALVIKDAASRAERLRWAVVFFPYWVLFALGNLIKFQPWIWDNTKIFAWSSLGVSGLASYTVNRFWESRGNLKIGVSGKWVAAWLLAITTLSGGLDAYQVIEKVRRGTQMYSAEDLELAKWVRENTPTDGVWLTGPYHNNWLFNLTGRQAVMGAAGWLWSHGYDYGAIEKDVKTMFDSPNERALFEKYRVKYVVIGEFEENTMNANRDYFRLLFKTVHETKNQSIFEIVPRAQVAQGAPSIKTSTTPMFQPPTIDPIKGNPAKLRPGLQRALFGTTDFTGPPISEEATDEFNFHYDSDKPRPFPSIFSMAWNGFLKIERDDIYFFSLRSDDGSRLYLNDRMLIDNGGTHGLVKKSTAVSLKTGLYRIKVDYFDSGGGAILEARWGSINGAMTSLQHAPLYSDGKK